MAETAALETQVAELSAERTTLTQLAGELKARVTTLESELKTATDGKVAELSAARIDATATAIKAERDRIGDVVALCNKSGKAELSAKFIADGTAVADVQSQLFAALCAGAKPIGDAGKETGTGGTDENAKYKGEFATLSAKDKAAFGDEAGYVAMRRIDDGIDQLTTKAA